MLWSCSYHHFQKPEGMYNAAWVKSWLSNDFTVYTYSAGVYGSYNKWVYLFICLLPLPPCVYEHTDVMDLWRCICTCGCEQMYAHPSVHACTHSVCVCVCNTCVNKCVSVCEHICAESTCLCAFIYVCRCIYIYIPMHFASRREPTHLCVCMQVCDTCMGIDSPRYF